LSKDLNAALDLNRSKSQAVIVEVLDPAKSRNNGYIVFGLLSVVYGLSIYYLLPLAFLSFDFGLILMILFGILVGMILGLSMLAFNVQRFLEIVLTYVCLFWEKASMRRMILTNLSAHRHRNKMTSIIYSISLGFLIFLVVAYNLELQVLQQNEAAY
jgi:hypothetical protein